MQRKGCALADRHWAAWLWCHLSLLTPTWGGRAFKYPTPGPRHFSIRAGRLSPHEHSQRSRSHWPQPARGLSSLLLPPPWGPEGMWTPLTLDYSSHTESQAPGLMRTRGENSNGLETRQAGSLGPLRDTGPSGLTEKVRLRPLYALETGVFLNISSHCWAGVSTGSVKTASTLKEVYVDGQG